jgi:uncharacterized membrane protein
MEIEDVIVEPKKPAPEELLKVIVKLRNESTEEAVAKVNATLSRWDSSFPNTLQQARVLQPGEHVDVTLLEMVVDERFQPGQYKVRVWLAGQNDIVTEKELEIDESKGFKKTF